MRQLKVFLIFLLGAGLLPPGVFAAQGPQIANRMDRTLSIETFQAIRSGTEATLPAPVLLPEPDYTLGNQNAIHWDRQRVVQITDSMGLTLEAFYIEAQIDTTLLWAPLDASADSALFIYLPEGIEITYRLRYYAKQGQDIFMSVWSNEVVSIQDAHVPVLGLHSGFLNMQQGGTIPWIVGKNSELHIMASDSLYGKVQQVVIHEASEEIDEIWYYDFDVPSLTVDQTIPYTILTSDHVPVDLTFWVVDVAGQVSGTMHQTLFWWPEDGAEKQVICFPNPFRPEAGERSIIKVNQAICTSGKIFDPFGNYVVTLNKPEDVLYFEWDGRNGAGDLVASGGYLFVVDNQPRLYCKIAVFK